MIVRTTKNNANPYTRLDHAAVNDERLSYKAIGIHTYLMSKPAGWKANETDITARHNDGKSAVRSGVQELIQYGYMVRVQVRKGKKIVEWRLDTYESPSINPHYDPDNPVEYIVENLDTENQNLGDLDTDNQDVDNQNLGSTGETEKPEADLDSEKLDLEKLDLENRNHSKELKEVTIEESDPANAGPPPPTADDEKEQTPQQKYFGKICDIVGWDYKTITEEQQGQVAQTAGILRKAKYTQEDLERFGSEVWAKDWRWKKHKSYPTLSQLRAEIGKLKNNPATFAATSRNGSTNRYGVKEL